MNTLKKIVPILVFFLLMAMVIFAQNALFVNTAGNVGIGTESPGSNLHVLESTGDVTTTIETTEGTSTANLVIKNASTSWTIQVSGSDLRILDNTGSAKVTVGSAGNVTLANNLTANNLTAANATVSGTVTAPTIDADTFSGNVSFTGTANFSATIKPSKGVGFSGYYSDTTSPVRGGAYNALNSVIPNTNDTVFLRGVITYYTYIEYQGSVATQWEPVYAKRINSTSIGLYGVSGTAITCSSGSTSLYGGDGSGSDYIYLNW